MLRSLTIRLFNNSARSRREQSLPVPAIVELLEHRQLLSGVSLGTVIQNNADFQTQGYGLFFHYFPDANPTLLPGTATDPILGPYSKSASIQAGQTSSAWSQAVDNFDVNGFANDVAASGAGYVMFTIGQANGYYCSPNSAYNAASGNLTGEFTSQRDLISDVADALARKNISLFAYISSTGPNSAYPVARSNSNGTTSLVYVNANMQAIGDANNTTFRTAMINMVTEWSTRWGTKVSGWWIDGCWMTGWQPGTMNPANSSNPAANLDSLIAACKAGNPNALVAANGGSATFAAITGTQNYLAGETFQPGYLSPVDPGEPLDRFPTWNPSNPKSSGTVSQMGSNMQWHYLTFLGSNWGQTGTRFTADQLAAYTYYVNQSGGVVTYDVTLGATGRMDAAQLADFATTKKVIRSGQSLKQSSNLAYLKPALEVFTAQNSQTGYNPYVEWPSNFVYGGSFATDGLTTVANGYAMGGGGDWGYTLEVQFRGNQTFNQVVVTFGSAANTFATKYHVDALSGGQWRTIAADWSVTSGGRKTLNLPTTTAEAIRVVNDAPNGPGQGVGGANAEAQIFEVEVYRKSVTIGQASTTNVAAGKPAYYYSNDWLTQLGPSGPNLASYVDDGDLSTVAQAAGNYAYTMMVDLQATNNVKKIEIDFQQGLYATQFQLLLHKLVNGIPTWVTQGTYNNTSDKPFTITLSSSVSVDQIAIRSLAPNAPGQPGLQMAIAELRVYSVATSTLSATASPTAAPLSTSRTGFSFAGPATPTNAPINEVPLVAHVTPVILPPQEDQKLRTEPVLNLAARTLVGSSRIKMLEKPKLNLKPQDLR